MTAVPFRTVIGLEVHVQLLTRTKLFCGCSTKFGLPANSATCPVCIGMPGVLPVMNRRAFDLALMAAKALHCRIAIFTKWDRKNYYYPDLPKNYQISQYDLPFSADGWLEIESREQAKKVGIIRVHLEEDAGKMMHDEKGGRGASLIDLNRAGTPLLEIVTRPELTSADEAKAFLEDIRLMLREEGISDCEMQEGSLRCDANVNLHIPLEDGTVAATPIVEVKNLNSFRAVERAIKYEGDRQHAEFLATGKREGVAPKATAGWDEVRGITIVQRRKEEASDYRYFPEPDLVPVQVDHLPPPASRQAAARVNWHSQLATVTEQDEAAWQPGAQPATVRRRLRERHGLSPYDALVLTRQGRSVIAYFEQVARLSTDSKEASNWVTNQVLRTLNDSQIAIEDLPLLPQDLADLIRQRSGGLNMQRARDVYEWMLATTAQKKVTSSSGYQLYAPQYPPCPVDATHAGYRSQATTAAPPKVSVYCQECGALVGDLPFPSAAQTLAEQAIDKLGLRVVGDEDQLRELVRRAIAANPRAVTDFRNGKAKAADAIKGAIMRETKGMAKTEVIQRLLSEELEKP